MRNCQSVLLQADGAFMYENREVITESGTWTAPAGATRLRLILVGKGQSGTAGQAGTMGGESPFGGYVAGQAGADGTDGAGGLVWTGTIDINPQQQFTVTIGEQTVFGAYSSANGVVYPNGYSDVASGDTYARTGVAAPKAGSGDGGAGGAGGNAGASHRVYYTVENPDGSTSEKYYDVVDVETGQGKPGVAGATGCAVVYWDKEDA